MSAELKAIFRLDLSSVAADAEKAASIIKAQVSGISISGATIGRKIISGDDSRALDNYFTKLQKVDKLAQSIVSGKWKYTPPKSSGVDLTLEAWRAAKPGGVAPGMKISIAPPISAVGPSGIAQKAADEFGAGGLATAGMGLPPTSDEIKANREKRIKQDAIEARRKDLMEKDAQSTDRDRGRFYKNLTFLAMPLFNPASMWATLFSTRQTFEAFSGTEMGRRTASRIGATGIAGGGVNAGAALMTAGLVAAATAAGLALKAMTESIKGAIAAYDKASAMYAKSLMSGVGIGFSVHRETLASIIGVSEKDLFQFGAAIAYLNPKIADATKILSDTDIQLTSVSWAWKVLKVDIQAMFALIANELAPEIKSTTDSIDAMVKGLNKMKWAVDLITLGVQAVTGIGNKSLTAVKAIADAAIASAGGNPFKNKNNLGVPEPIAYMKQLNFSAWEKMGLVIGGKSKDEYAKETAMNTKETVQLLKQMFSKPLNPATTVGIYTAIAAMP